MSDLDKIHLNPNVRAQGVVVALIGALLERRGEVAPGEFGELLGIMSVLAAETDEEAGNILAIWTAFAREQAYITAPSRAPTPRN